MGQTLSEPVTEKDSRSGEDARLYYGVSAMQGWRISMEDAHTTVLSMMTEDTDDAVAIAEAPKRAFFGVYDGHGGEKVALFAGENIHKIVKKQEAFKAGNFEQALKDGFLATDRAILGDPKYEDEVSGCTACVGLITEDKIYIANAGDSRGVLGVKGRAKPLSVDHKPQNEGEKARIQAAGGFVDFGRVNGNLALSRAIGDFEFKKGADLAPEQQIVTAYPDVMIHDLTDDDEFLVLACDGIWDCQSSQAVVEFVRRGIAAKQELEKICENMMDNCLASNSETGGVGCDNMTMIIIGFLHGRSKEEWYEEVGRRVANGDGPCAPPEYAEFRGPGVHHNFDDSDSGYEIDSDRTKIIGNIPGMKGRVILLGDRSEVMMDSGGDDTEMFDGAEEKDLDSQVAKSASSEETAAAEEGTATTSATTATTTTTTAAPTTTEDKEMKDPASAVAAPAEAGAAKVEDGKSSSEAKEPLEK